MKLYHFTHRAKIANITKCGLEPAKSDFEAMTLGHPVVWLTAGENDFAWISSDYTEPPQRLTVRLEPNNRRLANYAAWIRKQRGGFFDGYRNIIPYTDMLKQLSPERQMNWFVYFGTIPPEKIQFPLA